MNERPGECTFEAPPSTLQPNPTTPIPRPEHQLQSALTSNIPTPIDSQPQHPPPLQPSKPPSPKPPTYEPLPTSLPTSLLTSSQLRSTILLTSLSTTPNINRFVPFTSVHGIEDLYDICASRWGDYLNYPFQVHQQQQHQVQKHHQGQQESEGKWQAGQKELGQGQVKGIMKDGEMGEGKEDKFSNREENRSRKSDVVKRILIEIPWSNVWVEMVRGHRTTCQFDWMEFLRILRNAWGGVDGREIQVGERSVLYVRVRVCVDEVGGF